MTDRKLFLLDAYALIYRAYYALIRAPRFTSKGMNTSAIFGFVNTLDEVLKKEKPTHIAVCFDPPGPTFRHEAYEKYKATREKQPEDITRSLPYIKRIVEAYRIPVIEIPGYEADDVIGTLSRRAEAEGFTTYMMTPDKDYGQLVTDRVLIYKPGLRGADPEIRGPKEVCARYGIKYPSQVIDLLALEGDAIDNIPGCPGVGEKTAVKLIAEWGNVENLLANTDKLKGAIQRKVSDNADQIRESKFLATISTDVPADIDLDKLKHEEIDTTRLIPIFEELEFRTFVRRLAATKPAETHDVTRNNTTSTPAQSDGMGSLFDLPAEPENTATPVADSYTPATTSYITVDTPEEVMEFVNRAIKCKQIGVASYSVGEADFTARWLGIAIATGHGKATYIPLPPPAPDNLHKRTAILDALKPIFTSPDITVISHDIKREMVLLHREGIELTAPYADTSVAHYLLEPEMNHALPRVAAAYLAYHTLDYNDGERMRKKGAPVAAGEEALRTNEEADITLRLYPILSKKIDEDALRPLLDDIEIPLIAVLADMEITGVRIDPAILHQLSLKFTRQLHVMEEKAYELAGGTFNIGSPFQVGEILFDRLQLDPKAKRTKKGGYSTTEEILDKYRDRHPIVNLILDIRALRKLLVTYVDALPLLINPATGKIHTTFNQTVTATGRISSTNPNLQNIPIRSDDGREIRRAFIADRGDLFMSADYSQIELRVIADISGDPDMIEAFTEGRDIHRATAAKIYHESIDNVTDEQRRKAKTANFGIIYGISAFGLAQRLHIPRTEAKELIDGYFRSYPHIRDYMAGAIESARNDGYVKTIMGRKRMLPDIRSGNSVVRGYAERNAINAPIQGSAADIIKRAMVDIWREMRARGLKSKMIMQVHDELIFNVVPEELALMQTIVTEKMSGAYRGRIPLEVSCGTATNWLDAH